jgi:hypothetical protein
MSPAQAMELLQARDWTVSHPQNNESVYLSRRARIMPKVSLKERERLSTEIAGLESLDLNRLDRDESFSTKSKQLHI